MSGYCNKCHKLLEPGQFTIQRGAKICNECIEKEKREKEIKKERAVQNDKDRQELYSFLLGLFPIGKIPESWASAVDLMIKKGIDVATILLTLKYCQDIDRPISENNWTILVYLYYEEAKRIKKEQAKIHKKNEELIITHEVNKIRMADTTYRDMPSYRIEDL